LKDHPAAHENINGVAVDFAMTILGYKFQNYLFLKLPFLECWRGGRRNKKRLAQ
jgi:hypothetical protein